MHKPRGIVRLLTLAAMVGGMLIPGFFWFSGFQGVHFETAMLWFWPSAILLMALEGVRGTAGVIGVWSISIGLNVALYCVVALLGRIVVHRFFLKPNQNEA